MLTSITEEHRMLQDMVAKFVARELMPLEPAVLARESTGGKYGLTEEEEAPLLAKCKELGLWGLDVPEEMGGADLPAVARMLVEEEVSRTIVPFEFPPDSPNLHMLKAVASPWQREAYLTPYAEGRMKSAIAISEPGAGGDPAGMLTRAVQDGDDWVLNGRKIWVSRVPYCDFIIVMARTGEGKREEGMTAFIVERGFKGFSTQQKLDKIGMRGSDTCELVFEDCEVPEENVLGKVGRGVNVLMSGLDYERAVLAAGPLGIMQACMDVVLPYIHERKQFGQPIGSFQLVQAKVADMYVTMNACKAYVYAVAKSCDRGETTREDAAGAILYAAEKATQCALDAIQLLGGNGYINDYPTGRLLRDAKLYEIGAGTSEIRRMLIGRELFEKTA